MKIRLFLAFSEADPGGHVCRVNEWDSSVRLNLRALTVTAGCNASLAAGMKRSKQKHAPSEIALEDKKIELIIIRTSGNGAAIAA